MELELETAVAVLSRTPAALDALLRDLPQVWTRCNEGEGTMTAFDVVGHLIHAERTNWLPRVRILLQSSGNEAFGPFHRWGHVKECEGKRLEQLLDEFAALRAQNLADLRALALGPEDLARRGRHPKLGTVTVSQLLATWTAHDLTHLHQISRIFASQYREAVGPFSAFLGVMQCNGHSA